MKSGVPIVAGGGFYSQPFYPKEISTMSEEQIVKALIKQADDDTLGVFGEIGSWDEITADERKVFRAVGKAHVATNLSIFTHTGIPGKSALEQLDILEDAGVKPERVVIGHLGNLVDTNVYVHKAGLQTRRIRRFRSTGWKWRRASKVPMVIALIEAGFADHLMFFADASSGYPATLDDIPAEAESSRRERSGAAPDHGGQLPAGFSRSSRNDVEKRKASRKVKDPEVKIFRKLLK